MLSGESCKASTRTVNLYIKILSIWLLFCCMLEFVAQWNGVVKTVEEALNDKDHTHMNELNDVLTKILPYEEVRDSAMVTWAMA